MKKRIYYFTGTGNSMRAARVIANKLGDVEIVSMRMNPMNVPAKLVVPRTERKLKKLAEAISKNEARPYPRANAFVRKKRNSKMDPYLELQKYADNPFTVSDECISCGLCSRVCPCNNLAIENGRPVFMHHCANCMACVVNCPKQAIGYEITSQDSKLLEASNTKTPLVKIMGLPKRRKLYRNPYITSSDLTKEREQWPKEEKQKM